MQKEDFYKKTEAALYEYFTLEVAISNLRRRKETDMLEKKESAKQEMDSALQNLSAQDRDFINHVYGDPEANVSYLQNLFMMSQATFYRKKQLVVKKVALYLGYL